MGHLREALHDFVEKNIVATDPHPEYSWLDRQSLELNPPEEELPLTG